MDALDGKWVRGAGAHGAPVQLLCLARHDGLVRGQMVVPAGTSEITAAPALLAEQDLHGRVITADALLTQRHLSAQIVAQGGDYLLAVKGNQPELAVELAKLFACCARDSSASPVARMRTVDKGHGRLEIREIEASSLLNDWLDWPALGQVLKQTCRRMTLKTGIVTETVRYAITSLPVGTDLGLIARLWCGHWSIENKVHYVRDVTCREDAGQAYRGNTPQVLAALRNAVLTLLRASGWSRIADGMRHYAAHPTKALALVAARRLCNHPGPMRTQDCLVAEFGATMQFDPSRQYPVRPGICRACGEVSTAIGACYECRTRTDHRSGAKPER